MDPLEQLEQLATRKELDLQWHGTLARLPDGLGCLGALTRLNLAYCRALTELPA